jgi:hypothetical protein
MNSYVYNPLQNNRLIRLLHLLPGADDEPIQFRPVEHRLSEGEERFTALSYAWGDASDQTPVLIRDDELATPIGRELLIIANLYTAIWQIRQSGKYYILWADAICIN